MVEVVSFYMDNINTDVVTAQRRVMDKFCKHPFTQIKTDKSHAHAMDDYMTTSADEVVIFLDIDAIPLSPVAIDRLLWLCGDSIAGAPQRANHLDNNGHIYVAPSVMAIDADFYHRIGAPSARPTSMGDVAEEWTYIAERYTKPMYLDIISVEFPKWELDDRMFGLNTIYGLGGEELFFHAFEGRSKSQQQRFIEIANSI
jgi:hypothetical protein